MVLLTRLLRFAVKVRVNLEIQVKRICGFHFQLRDGGTLYEDASRIYVRGGNGGKGLPGYGGVGGDGGDVILEASMKASLQKLNKETPKKRFIAEKGRHSS